MFLLPACAAFALAVPVCSLRAADAQVRSAQERLTTLGFYTGPANGELTPATKGALRRFQIFSGLKTASGELDAETLAALSDEGGEGSDKEAAAAPPPASPSPSPAGGANDREFLRKEAEKTHPAPAPVTPLVPEIATAADPARWYPDAPYQKAPPEVQRETLRKAQEQLRRRRFYASEGETFSEPAMEEALFRFQSAEGLRLSGRLDLATLTALRLLPAARSSSGGGDLRQPFYPPKGEETDPPPAGAVRGIPLD